MSQCQAVAAILVAIASVQAPVSQTLTLVESHSSPVLTTRSPGAEGNRCGFEGGRVVKVGKTYHLFTSEMAGDPVWVRMKLAHWRSDDRLHWTRVSTVLIGARHRGHLDPPGRRSGRRCPFTTRANGAGICSTSPTAPRRTRARSFA
jgi:hypothetical protein